MCPPSSRPFSSTSVAPGGRPRSLPHPAPPNTPASPSALYTPLDEAQLPEMHLEKHLPKESGVPLRRQFLQDTLHPAGNTGWRSYSEPLQTSRHHRTPVSVPGVSPVTPVSLRTATVSLNGARSGAGSRAPRSAVPKAFLQSALTHLQE